MRPSLQGLIRQLDAAGELQRVAVPVRLEGELATIVRRVSAGPAGGPALLFEQPGAAGLPVAANLFGSVRRMEAVLGARGTAHLGGAFEVLLETLPEVGLVSLGEQLNQHPALISCRPVTVIDPPCREQASKEVDLLQLPFPQNWPGDGAVAGTGRYITLGQVFTAAPDGSSPNCGIYRCQIHDRRTLAIRWRHGSGADQHHQLFKTRKERMPLAIVLGGPPCLTLAAAWPLPPGLDELCFAGWLQGQPIAVTGCMHGPLQVPADAELVLEGFAEPDETLLEGPFGNHTGRYAAVGSAARVTITRITRRNAPIIPITVVGPPPQEDCWMMLGWERLLAALVRQLVPGVRDLCLPLAWVFRNSAVIALETSDPLQVRTIIRRLWQLPWFSTARLLVLVDAAAVAPGDLLRVTWQVVNEADWQTDLVADSTGARLALDATRKQPGELLEEGPIGRLVSERWKEYGLL
ncbi:MAG: UbiD family decarboxylase [Geobacter sp.]|nr:UbiD family decarboxylase [Geobacter sp.]